MIYSHNHRAIEDPAASACYTQTYMHTLVQWMGKVRSGIRSAKGRSVWLRGTGRTYHITCGWQTWFL